MAASADSRIKGWLIVVRFFLEFYYCIDSKQNGVMSLFLIDEGHFIIGLVCGNGLSTT